MTDFNNLLGRRLHGGGTLTTTQGPAPPQSEPKPIPERFVDPDMDAMIQQCVKIMNTKNPDYTIGSGDVLYNFRRVGELTGLTPTQVWSVYFMKHVFAISNYVKSGSESENIEERIADAINYLLFLAKIVAENKTTR